MGTSAWDSLGDIFSDSKDKKFEMWTGFGDIFGGKSPISADGEPVNIENAMGKDPSSFLGIKGALGTKNDKTGIFTEGKLGAGIGAFTGIANAYLGWQQFNLAKDQMAQNKKIFNLNFSTQAQTLNTQMEDRQRARVASGEQVDSVDTYMKKNAISGKGV